MNYEIELELELWIINYDLWFMIYDFGMDYELILWINIMNIKLELELWIMN